MKRILFPSLIFALIIFLLPSCSLLKPGYYKLKGSYITTQSINLMNANTRSLEIERNMKLENSEGNISNRGNTLQLDTSELQHFKDIIEGQSWTDGYTSHHLNHFDPSDNGCEMECCDLSSNCPTPSCPVYLVEQSCQYIISKDPITECIIYDPETNEEVTRTTGSFLEIGDYYFYYISLSELIIDKIYLLNMNVINTRDIVEDYEILIKVY